MRWLEIAWADQGVHEIAGPGAEPRIVAYFRDAGRPDISSDEVPWCAGFVGACLSRGGVPPTLPTAERLLARSYLNVGTPIEKARTGCIAVLKRGSDPRAGHVGFVVGETQTHIAVLGGNQSNAVTVAHFPKSQVLGYRWPLAEVTPRDLDKQGSRIAGAARGTASDAAAGGGTQVLPQPPDLDPAALVGKGAALKADAIRRIVARADEIASMITGAVPLAERLSWPVKEAAARAIIVGTATAEQQSLIAAEAQVTGETVADLAQRIVGNATVYVAAAGMIAGQRRKVTLAIDALNAPETMAADIAAILATAETEAQALLAQVMGAA